MPDQRLVSLRGVVDGLHPGHDQDMVADGCELMDKAAEPDSGILQNGDAMDVGHPLGGWGEPINTGSRERCGQRVGVAELGPHTTGKACLNVKRLDDIDLEVLERLISDAWKA